MFKFIRSMLASGTYPSLPTTRPGFFDCQRTPDNKS
jgi:hypothetical protein